MISLYYSANSPYARKVRIALAEKGLDFEPQLLTAAPLGQGRVFPESFESLNPNLRVPLLVDGGLQLWESNAILDYLFKTYSARKGAGTPPFADSLTRPERHWQDLMILVTIETLLDSAINLFQFIRHGMNPDEVPYLRREQMRTQSELDWLERQATPEGFWPGRFSMMDANLICTLGWIDFRKPVEWRGRPRLEAILQRFDARPSVQSTRPKA
jgi:glutathione S-transferase